MEKLKITYNKVTDFDTLFNDANEGNIFFTYVTSDNVAEFKGFPAGAYGYGLMITLGSKISYLKLQIYIIETGTTQSNLKIYYRTRISDNSWKSIIPS